MGMFSGSINSQAMAVGASEYVFSAPTTICVGARPSGRFTVRDFLSTPFQKYDHVCCVDFRFWRGATREHPPQWGCDRGATKPEPKSDATLRAAVLFGPDVVARSLQTPEGYARRSRLVWAKNSSPQTWSYLWNGALSQRNNSVNLG